MNEHPAVPWGRIAAAGLVVLVLTLCGVVWLAFSQELLRTEIRELRQIALERPEKAPPSPLEGDVKALREAVAKLTAKVDAIRIPDASKPVDRLAVEVKNLANRVEAMENAAKAQSREPKSKKAAAQKSAPAAQPQPQPQVEEYPNRPFFGPGLPAYPGY